MNDTPPQHVPQPDDTARPTSVPTPEERADSVSDLRGWPGAVLGSARDGSSPPATAPTAPRTADFGAGVPNTMPTGPRVEEVQAIPVPSTASRAPAIEVEGRAVPPRESTAPNVGDVAGGNASAGARATANPDAPPSGATGFGAAAAAHPPRASPWSSSAGADAGRAGSPMPGAGAPAFGGIPPGGPTVAGAFAATPSGAYAGQRVWAVLAHLAYLVPLPPHIAGIVITAILWVVRRNRDPFTAEHGREALNFQITYLGINTLLGVSCIGHALVPVVWIVGAVLCIVAAVNTGEGQRYRYPFIFRLIA